MAALLPQQLGLAGRLQRSQQQSLASSSHASASAAQPRALARHALSGSTASASSVARRAAGLQSKASRRRLAVLVRAEAAAPWKVKDTRLVLEDGTVLRGTGFGAKGTTVGEVVFNTSLTVSTAGGAGHPGPQRGGSAGRRRAMGGSRRRAVARPALTPAPLRRRRVTRRS
jgi:hypothetical protein